MFLRLTVVVTQTFYRKHGGFQVKTTIVRRIEARKKKILKRLAQLPQQLGSQVENNLGLRLFILTTFRVCEFELAT